MNYSRVEFKHLFKQPCNYEALPCRRLKRQCETPSNVTFNVGSTPISFLYHPLPKHRLLRPSRVTSDYDISPLILGQCDCSVTSLRLNRYGECIYTVLNFKRFYLEGSGDISSPRKRGRAYVWARDGSIKESENSSEKNKIFDFFFSFLTFPYSILKI